MRLLFLEIETEADWSVASLGPAFMAPGLRERGHEVLLLRAVWGQEPEAVAQAVHELSPDLLGLSLTTRQWGRARRIVAEVEKIGSIPVVTGGLHPTFAPEAVLATPGFDWVCLGEGEEAIIELVEALERGADTRGIANMWSRGGPRPKMRPPLEPMDALPWMARDMLDEYTGVVNMTTQRGCPFPCTYCAARMYHDLYRGTGDYGRRRSHRNVLDELHAIRRDAYLSYVIFLDDTFTIHHPWVHEFCDVFPTEIGVPFSLNARVETVDERLIDELATAGCRHITYGVESGSPRVRREVMRRYASNQRFEDVFRWTREAGIMVTANYMMGLPGETADDVEQTLELADRLAADDFAYFVFYPYPGTHLFHVCRERGYLPEDWLDREANHRESILTLPDLTADQIRGFYDRFTELRADLYAARGAAHVTHVHDRASRA